MQIVNVIFLILVRHLNVNDIISAGAAAVKPLRRLESPSLKSPICLFCYLTMKVINYSMQSVFCPEYLNRGSSRLKLRGTVKYFWGQKAKIIMFLWCLVLFDCLLVHLAEEIFTNFNVAPLSRLLFNSRQRDSKIPLSIY